MHNKIPKYVIILPIVIMAISLSCLIGLLIRERSKEPAQDTAIKIPSAILKTWSLSELVVDSKTSGPIKSKFCEFTFSEFGGCFVLCDDEFKPMFASLYNVNFYSNSRIILQPMNQADHVTLSGYYKIDLDKLELSFGHDASNNPRLTLKFITK